MAYQWVADQFLVLQDWGVGDLTDPVVGLEKEA